MRGRRGRPAGGPRAGGGITRAALPVGGRFRIAEIGAEQLSAEARSWGVPERIAVRTIDGAVEAIIAAAEDVTAAGVPDHAADTTRRSIRRLAMTVAARRR